MSVDTGGRAYLDSNDFSRVFRGVQQDMDMYYLLGYHSTNAARDGKFRRITVRVNRPDVKLEYRKGYYAAADFKHSNKEDRERQLQEELASDLPSTDLPLYLATGYFRLADNRVLYADFTHRSRLGNSIHPQSRSGQGDAGCAGGGDGREEISGRRHPRHGQARGQRRE